MSLLACFVSQQKIVQILKESNPENSQPSFYLKKCSEGIISAWIIYFGQAVTQIPWNSLVRADTDPKYFGPWALACSRLRSRSALQLYHIQPIWLYIIEVN